MINLIMFFEKVSMKGRVGHVIGGQFPPVHYFRPNILGIKKKTLTKGDEQKQNEHIYNESRSK